MQILDAAERLFAERGVDAVSLREINAAAGQKNASSIQYHFGNRDGLLAAVIERHMSDVDADRLAVLEGAATDSVRALVQALVAPLAGKLGSTSGRRYLRVLAQLVDLPAERALGAAGIEGNESFRRCLAGLDRLMAALPAEVRAERSGQALAYTLRALADLAARPRNRHRDDLAVANLVDMLDAMITAPVSAATRRVVGRVAD